MKQHSSLVQKMNRHMLLFAVLPLCALLLAFLLTSFNTFIQETASDLASDMLSCDTDMQLFRTQTENVLKMFITSEHLSHLLQSRSQAEWVTAYNAEAYDEATRVEGYLSSLGAKMILVYNDHGAAYSEHWATLLSEERYQDMPFYRALLERGESTGWYGLEQALPDEVAASFDFRGIGKRILYLSRPHTLSQRVDCTVICALSPDPFVFAALRRMGETPYRLFSGEEILSTSLPEAVSVPEDLSGHAYLIRQGYLWRQQNIKGMRLSLVACLSMSSLLGIYLRRNGLILLLLIAAVLLLFLISRRVLQSLLLRMERLALTADRIRGDENVALPEEDDDEVGRVVGAINRLLERIEVQSREKIQAEKDKRKMQALALQYQLNPHFLFNSLLWVQMEMERQNMPDHTSDAVATLGQVLRYNLTGSLTADLSEEIEHLRAYTSFMAEMKQQSIDLTVLPDAILPGCTVPRFILQPLVENALQHGLVPGQPLKIRIALTLAEQSLEIAVHNDGKLIDAVRLEQIRETFRAPDAGRGMGYGISNLIKRLHLTYSDRFTISVQSECTEEGPDTVFTLTIPLTQNLSNGGGRQP